MTNRILGTANGKGRRKMAEAANIKRQKWSPDINHICYCTARNPLGNKTAGKIEIAAGDAMS
jgi:hypothetical protein